MTNDIKNKKSIVLLSAGLDSTVNLFLAHKKTNVHKTITFNYGQRAFKKEIEQSRKLSEYLGIAHQIIELPWLKNIGQSSLTNEHSLIPTGKNVVIDDISVSNKTAKSVWVPNRNGIFLNIAAAIAESDSVDSIIPGFNVEEAATFPDNTIAYMESVTNSFKYSTSNHVSVVSYTIDMNKTEIMKTALDEKIPLKLIWPCYFGNTENDKWCGECESCLRTKRAMVNNKIDLSEYF